MSSSSERWHSFPLAALADGERRLLQAGDREIALFRVGDEVYAVDNACPHSGNPLIEGELLGRTLVCAYHAWRFDLETGACLFGDEPVRRYPVQLGDAEIRVDVSD